MSIQADGMSHENSEIELRLRLTAKQAILLFNCVKERADGAVSCLRFCPSARQDRSWQRLAELVNAAIVEATDAQRR